MTDNTWVSIPDGSWPGYQVNRSGQLRDPDGVLLTPHRPRMPDPTDDSEDSYTINGSIAYKAELIELCFGTNSSES